VETKKENGRDGKKWHEKKRKQRYIISESHQQQNKKGMK